MFYLTEPNILFYMTNGKFFFEWNQHSLLKTASSKVKLSLHYLGFRIINLSSRAQKWFNENTIFYTLCTVLWFDIFQLLPWKSYKTLFPQVFSSSLSVRRLSFVRPLTFHILINSSEATGPIWTNLWWNGPWMAPFQNCVRWSWLPTKMAAKLKIEKRGDEILIVHCCFSISQNELKF